MIISDKFIFKIHVSVIVFGTFFVGNGCARTNLASYIDTEYKTRAFKKVLVLAPLENLQYRQKIETEITKGLRYKGFKVFIGGDLFPPTRQWSDEERLKVIQENKIDCFLIIQIKDAGYEEAYIPPSTNTSTRGRATTSGNLTRYKETTTTTQSGGYNVKLPWADFEAKLIDADNGQTAWLGSASTGGNALASNSTLISSFAYEVVSQLAKTTLLKKDKE
jgi:hypothetical protein